MIKVWNTSPKRTQSDKVDDKQGNILGSGSVYIPEKYAHKNIKCPCRECEMSGNAKMEWYEVYVTTAHHIIFDDHEASHSTIKLDFNTDDDKENVVKLSGYRVVSFKAEADRSILSCITHNAKIVEHINRLRTTAKEYEELFSSSPITTNQSQNLIVIVSHPHGKSKKISFGTTVEIQTSGSLSSGADNIVWTEYAYDAPTCPGSSGALVWIYGKKRVGFRDSEITTHTHSGVDNDLNRSGLGLEFRLPIHS